MPTAEPDHTPAPARVTIADRFHTAAGILAAVVVLTGLSVLADLGLLPAGLERGSRVEALECRTPRGRSVLDLRYRELVDGWCGLGMHRGALARSAGPRAQASSSRGRRS